MLMATPLLDRLSAAIFPISRLNARALCLIRIAYTSQGSRLLDAAVWNRGTGSQSFCIRMIQCR